MDILYLLVPLSVLVALGVLLVFAWALRAGQFEHIQAEADRIVFDADQTQAPGGDDRA